MFKKFVALLIVAVMVMSLSAGCTQETKSETPPVTIPETQPDGEKTEEPVTPLDEDASLRDTLVFNLGGDPKTFDPTMTSDATGGHVLNNLFDGLVRDEGDNKIAPACAESYDISDDGTVYTFHLRENLKWSDGQPLTARDFEYAWKRACSPENPSEYSFIMSPYIKGADAYIKGEGSADDMAVNAIDDNTLVVELNYPVPYFMSLVTFNTYKPARQDIIETYGDGWEKNPETCISNGPFKLAEYQVGSHLLLVKNENYWDSDNVKLPKLKMLMLEEAVTALSGYEAGEINVLGGSSIPTDEISRLRSEDPNMTTNPEIGTAYALFNVDAAPVNDVRVRKALTISIDRKAICDQVIKSGQLPATGQVPPALAFSDGTCFRKLDESGNPTPEYGIDPNMALKEEAQKLLAEAGYPDGKGFPNITFKYNTSDSNKKTVEAMQEMWKTNLNIDISLENMEKAVLLQLRDKGDYVIAMGGWYGDYADPMTMLDLFTSYSGNNDSQWRWNEQPVLAPWDTVLNPENKAFDEAIEKAQVTTGADRDDVLREAEEILMDNMVILPIYYHSNIKIIDESVVENVKLATMGQWVFKYAELIQ